MDHPDFGRAFPCDCLMAKFLVEQKLRQWKTASVPERFQNFTLNTSPLKRAAKRLISAPKESSWLLWGEKGVGKTGLAVGYLRQFLDAGFGQALFFSLPLMLAALKATYGKQPDPESEELTEAELITYWTRVPLLVVDDMGAEQVSGSGWVEDRLYQIIGQRHATLKPIFITSNLSPTELGHKLGDRILWRIVEMCGKDNIIHVTGPNLRA